MGLGVGNLAIDGEPVLKRFQQDQMNASALEHYSRSLYHTLTKRKINM